MQTIFCVYETEERFPRFILAAQDPSAAFEDVLAHALDGFNDEVSIWVASQIKAGKKISRYDLQSEIDGADLQFFVEYWECQFAEFVRHADKHSKVDEFAATRMVLAAIEEKESQN